MPSGSAPSRGGPSPQSDAVAPEGVYRRQVPAWLLSLGLHGALLLAIALIVPKIPQGAAEEPARTGGIVLVSQSQGPPQYLSEEDVGGDLTAVGEHAPQAVATEASATAAESPFPDVPNELAGLLPKGDASILGSQNVGEGTDRATKLVGGRGPAKGVGENYAETGVFGVTGRGTKFVYVFDRSGSMDGFQGRPLVAAKRELLASLDKLSSVHQFQIIFYNERPTILNPRHEAQPRMMYGNDTDKKVAQDFVRGILSDGGTRHLEALKLALRMGPDVIFFLTDADEPTLTNAELAEIRRLNDRVGASINAIEFGAGPRQHRESFLTRIARENSGAHVYVDVSKLPQH